MNKYSLIILFGLVVLLAFVGFELKEKSETITRVGFVLPITGPVAIHGAATQVGALLAQEDLKDVEVVLYDSAFDLDTARTVAEHATTDSLDGLFSSFTYITNMVSPIMRDAAIPLFYDSCNCGFAEENSLAFQNYFNPRQECRQLAERARDTGVDKIAHVSVDTDYAQFCYEAMVEILGADNVWSERVTNNNVDFDSMLEKINQFGAETVALVPSLPEYLPIFKANEVRDFDTELFCYEGTCMTRDARGNYPRSVLNNVYTFEIPVDESFVRRLSEYTFEKEHIFQAALAYDTVNYVHDAVTVCGENKDAMCIIDAIKNNETYESQLDSSGFDESGFLKYMTQYLKYTEGIPEKVDLMQR